MKKLITLIATVTVCLTMSATVFAAGSPVAPPVNTPTPTPTETVGPTTVTIDDILVTPEDVIENPDGTVTLPDSIITALDLGPGEHIVVFTFPDGTTRRYTITLGGNRNPSSPDTAPQTSDLLIVPGLAVVAIAGTSTAVIAKRKQQE
ncbi:MAG: hypothetical protein MJ094_06900 [Saccharofermentans sp.]|nr:hypothetical protein [Saccharofermentans sp.]